MEDFAFDKVTEGGNKLAATKDLPGELVIPLPYVHGG